MRVVAALSLLPMLFAAADMARLAEERTTAAVAAIAHGQFEQAARHAQEAARIARQAGLKEAEGRAHNELGNAEVYRGRYDSAISEYREAMRLAREGSNRRDEISALNNVGSILFFQGHYGDAWSVYGEARALTDAAIKAPWHSDALFKTAVNQATVLQRLGKDREAAQVYRELQAHDEKIAPPKRAQALANLGVIYRRLGDPVKAMELYRRALALFDQASDFNGRARTLKNIAIAQALDYGDLAGARRTLEGLLGTARAAGNKREELQSHLYLGEAASRNGEQEQAQKHWTVALGQAEALKAGEERWKALFGLGRVDEAIAEIERLRSSAGSQRSEFLSGKRDVYDERVERLLGGGASDQLLAAIERARARSFQEVRSINSLAEAQALLGTDELLLVYWAGARRTAVLWMTQTGAGVAEVSKADPLRGVADVGSPAIRLVTVVPDGWTAGVALDALKTRGSRLLEQKAVRYLPSSALLKMDVPEAAVRWPWSPGVLAAGGVPMALVKGLPGDEALPELPQAGEEVRDVGATMPGRSALALGSAANADSIRARALEFPVLHLAAHAVADDDPARSRLLVAGKPIYQRELGASSGIRMKPGALVVLSACRTAEGVNSLAAAMLQAGAGAVVASLRPVEDRAARAIMAHFYGRLAKGETAAEALRAAKLTMMRAGAPELLWEPFVIYGRDARYAAAGSRTPMWLTGAACVLLVTALLARRTR